MEEYNMKKMDEQQMALLKGGGDPWIAALWGVGGICCACLGPVGVFGAGVCYGMAISQLSGAPKYVQPK